MRDDCKGARSVECWRDAAEDAVRGGRGGGREGRERETRGRSWFLTNANRSMNREVRFVSRRGTPVGGEIDAARTG